MRCPSLHSASLRCSRIRLLLICHVLLPPRLPLPTVTQLSCATSQSKAMQSSMHHVRALTAVLKLHDALTTMIACLTSKPCVYALLFLLFSA